MSNPPKSTKLENRKEYKQFNRFLDTASNRTKENENKRKTYQTNLNHFRAGLISRLRGSNKLLEKMYVKEIVSGNYFDCPMDLKYHETNLNIILKVPFGDTNSVTVEKAPNKPGYCRICVDNTIWKQHETDPLAIEFHNNFLHKNNHLRVNEFTTWFECIFNEYFTENAYELEIGSKNQSETVKFSISKPVKSVTGLFIEVHVVDTNTRFSVAISLGMEFDRTVAFCQSKIPASITEKWVAVAKPHKNQNDVDWLCSFYTIERKILQCNPKTGSLIRICKQFCCAANIPNISTYLLENIFLREIVKQENAKQFDFWKSSLASLFLHMFNIILHSLNDKSIPYFWDGAVNLAVKLPHKKIYDELVIHRTELDHKINSSDPNVNFDDLFFKIEDHSNNNSKQNVEIANSSTPSTKSMVNGLLNFLGRFNKADCNPAENGVQTSPAINNTESTSNSNIDPIYVRESSSESQSSQSSLSAASPMSSLVEVIKKPNKSINATLILQLLSKFIKIKERKEYTEHYNAVLNFFVTELKKNDVFEQIYKGHVMGGSYTDDLKVSRADEFDTLLRFSFGVDKTKIRVEKCKVNPGYCNINLKECDLKVKLHLKPFLNEDGYLLQDEILKWMDRTFAKILQKYDQDNKTICINNQSYQYKYSKHGPAFTFGIKVVGTPIEFDMDLVPSIPFNETNWLASRAYPQDKNKIKWVAVPKPPKGGITNKNPSFICSYTELEKTYLRDMNSAKNLIRLFKKLRDQNNLTALKSYFIKTIFLWKLDNTTVSERNAFWSQSLDILFCEMFEKLLDHVTKRELFFYWETDYNMFSTVSPNVLTSMQQRLSGIYSKIASNLKDNKNPEYLIDIILTKEEKSVFMEENRKKLCRD